MWLWGNRGICDGYEQRQNGMMVPVKIDSVVKEGQLRTVYNILDTILKRNSLRFDLTNKRDSWYSWDHLVSLLFSLSDCLLIYQGHIRMWFEKWNIQGDIVKLTFCFKFKFTVLNNENSKSYRRLAFKRTTETSIIIVADSFSVHHMSYPSCCIFNMMTCTDIHLHHSNFWFQFIFISWFMPCHDPRNLCYMHTSWIRVEGVM